MPEISSSPPQAVTDTVAAKAAVQPHLWLSCRVLRGANPISDPFVPEVMGSGPGALDPELLRHQGRIGQLLGKAPVPGPRSCDDLNPDTQIHKPEHQQEMKKIVMRSKDLMPHLRRIRFPRERERQTERQTERDEIDLVRRGMDGRMDVEVTDISAHLDLILAESNGMAMESAIEIARLRCRIRMALSLAGNAPLNMRRPRV